MKSTKSTKSMLTIKSLLSLITLSSLMVSSNLMANSCNKDDINYYLQKGFSHDQVVMLCSASGNQTSVSSAPSVSTLPATSYTAPAAPAPNYQNRQFNSDQVFLSTALDARNVIITPQTLSYDAKECAVHTNTPNNSDLDDETCVQSHIIISTAGLKVLKASSGLFLIKDAEMLVQANVQRKYLNLNAIRKQERSAITASLPTQATQINIPVKAGMNVKQVADKLRNLSH